MLKKIHKYANPNKFISMMCPIKLISFYLSIIFIVVGLFVSLFFSPPDYQQGETV